MLAQIEEADDPDELPNQAMIMGMFEALTFTITLNEDGTATALYGSDGDPDNLAGTWSRDGDRLRVTLGHPGYDNDDELSGTIGDGFIRLTSTAMGVAEAVTFHRQGD